MLEHMQCTYAKEANQLGECLSLVVSYHSAKDATTRFSPFTFQPRSPMLVGLYHKLTQVIAFSQVHSCML